MKLYRQEYYMVVEQRDPRHRIDKLALKMMIEEMFEKVGYRINPIVLVENTKSELEGASVEQSI